MRSRRSNGQLDAWEASAASARHVDEAGAVLLVASAGWTVFAWQRVGGDPWAPVGVVVGLAAAVGVGRALARVFPWLPAACVVAAGAGSVVVWGSQAWSPSSWDGPLGYANARAAFFVVVALAALQLAGVLGRLWPLAVGFAGLAGILPIAVRSKGATVLLVVGALVVLLGVRPGRRRLAVTAAGAIAGAVLLVTVVAGATHGPDAPAGDVLEEGLSTRRLTLWHESLQLIGEHPLTGVGPGRFRLASPTARRDADAAWAHHGFLQQGVETGVPGMVLAVALVVWGFVALGRAHGPLSPAAAAASMAVAAHACVDYILHFPAVPIAAALLVGAGTAVARGEGLERRPQERSP